MEEGNKDGINCYIIIKFMKEYKYLDPATSKNKVGLKLLWK
jgi:hypothetical protein